VDSDVCDDLHILHMYRCVTWGTGSQYVFWMNCSSCPYHSFCDIIVCRSLRIRFCIVMIAHNRFFRNNCVEAEPSLRFCHFTEEKFLLVAHVLGNCGHPRSNIRKTVLNLFECWVLAECCNFNAKFGYCHKMLSVVCNVRILCQNDRTITRFSLRRSSMSQLFVQ